MCSVLGHFCHFHINYYIDIILNPIMFGLKTKVSYSLYLEPGHAKAKKSQVIHDKNRKHLL